MTVSYRVAVSDSNEDFYKNFIKKAGRGIKLVNKYTEKAYQLKKILP